MFWDLRDILLGIHVFAAIVWVGSVLFVGWGVFPAAKTLPVWERQRFLLKLMQHSHRPFTIAGIVVIISGILLGTVTGPLHSIHAVVTTTYGRVWLSALLVALFVLLWGSLVSYRYTIKKLKDPVVWKTAAEGSYGALNQTFLAIAAIASIEGAGFLILMALMITF